MCCISLMTVFLLCRIIYICVILQTDTTISQSRLCRYNVTMKLLFYGTVLLLLLCILTISSGDDLWPLGKMGFFFANGRQDLLTRNYAIRGSWWTKHTHSLWRIRRNIEFVRFYYGSRDRQISIKILIEYMYCVRNLANHSQSQQHETLASIIHR